MENTMSVSDSLLDKQRDDKSHGKCRNAAEEGQGHDCLENVLNFKVAHSLDKPKHTGVDMENTHTTG